MIQTNDMFGGVSITKAVDDIGKEAYDKHLEFDKWEGSRFEYIRKIGIKERGVVAEKICDAFIKYANPKAVVNFMKSGEGFNFESNGVNIQVKGASESKTGTFTVNQVRPNAGFDYLMLVTFFPDSFRLFVCKKQDILDGVESKSITIQHKNYIDGQDSGIYGASGTIKNLIKKMNLEEITI